MHRRLRGNRRRPSAGYSEGAHPIGTRIGAGVHEGAPAQRVPGDRLPRRRRAARRDSGRQRDSLRGLRPHQARPAEPGLHRHPGGGGRRRRPHAELRVRARRARQDAAAARQAGRPDPPGGVGRRPLRAADRRLAGPVPGPRRDDGARLPGVRDLLRVVRGDDVRRRVGFARVRGGWLGGRAVVAGAVPHRRGEVAAAGRRGGPVRGRVGLRGAVGADGGLALPVARRGRGHAAGLPQQRRVLLGGGVDGARVAAHVGRIRRPSARRAQPLREARLPVRDVNHQSPRCHRMLQTTEINSTSKLYLIFLR